MRCVKCKETLNNPTGKCQNCGYQNNMEYQKYIQDEQVQKNLIYYNNNKEKFINEVSNNSPFYNSNEYLNAYIGNNVDSFKKGGISFCYLFFGEYYLIYRKLYLPFLIKYLITILLLVIMIVAYFNSQNSIILGGFIFFVLLQIIPIFF